MYRDTVTVFISDGGAEGKRLWHPRVLRGVNLTLSCGLEHRHGGVALASPIGDDEAILNVRYRSACETPDSGSAQIYLGERSDAIRIGGRTHGVRDDAIRIGDMLYLPPKLWRTSAEDVKRRTLTFARGDFFCTGDADLFGGVVDEDNFDPTEGFYGYMRRTRDGVYMISETAVFSAIPHFVVRGK